MICLSDKIRLYDVDIEIPLDGVEWISDGPKRQYCKVGLLCGAVVTTSYNPLLKEKIWLGCESQPKEADLQVEGGGKPPLS